MKNTANSFRSGGPLVLPRITVKIIGDEPVPIPQQKTAGPPCRSRSLVCRAATLFLLASLAMGLAADIKPAAAAQPDAGRDLPLGADPTYAPRTNLNPALVYWQAYALLPDLSEADDQRVGDRRQARNDDATKTLAERFDGSFKLLHRAAQLQGQVDWGIDLSDGPFAMLPQLAKAKRMAQAATFRGNYYLASGREKDVMRDLGDAFVLGRHVGSDRVLISSLVQIAMENIVTTFVAENYYRLNNESLTDLQQIFATAPPRGTVARCIDTEQYAFVDWYRRKVEQIQKTHPNEQEAMKEIRVLILSTLAEGEDTNMVDKLIAASGGTSAGLKAHLVQTGKFCDELELIMDLPYAAYTQRAAEFMARINSDNQPLLQAIMPAILKSRNREFRAVAKMAMVQAAIELRRAGADGFNAVRDPFGDGPLGFERFYHDGVDRGFRLTSALPADKGGPETLIFIESPGTPIMVEGLKAGQPAADPAK